MPLVRFALRRPITVMVLVLAVALLAGLAGQRMPIDIFPPLGAPAIYVAQPFGGMDPAQMEGFLTYYYEYHFLYITGIEHVESKSIQGAALMKLVFHPGTDMNQAIAQTVGYVNRARAFMPPGAVPPFIVRFDAGSVPVGQLVFTSPNRPPSEMQDIALNRVRPLFATLPGVSAPPPFGGNQRTIVVRLDPDKLREYRVSPEEAIAAVNHASAVFPSGNVRTGDLNRIATTNAVVGGNLQELADAPVRMGSGPLVYIRDLGVVENGTDIVTGYAHVNGRRTVYIPVTKRSDASTLAVIQRVREALPAMQAVVPDDVKVSLEFDQSPVVTTALRSLVNEGLLGALLTGLMVLLFLRDWRSALIVILTIPFSLLSAVICLWALGQTLNIMTLGGLALAVGVLVDEGTVEIENIHGRLREGIAKPKAVLEACQRTAAARLLAMLCILAVFVSSFFMVGVGRQLFVPLALAVGCALISSYVLSSTLVPVLASWLMKAGKHEDRPAYGHYTRLLEIGVRWRLPLLAVYFLGAGLLLWLLFPRLGTELFPPSAGTQFQLRLRAPTGTRIERTEVLTLHALHEIQQEIGASHIAITTAFIGVQPASYPINTIYLWTSGPQEAVLTIALKPDAPVSGEALQERLRARLRQALPTVGVSFEAGDIVSQVMSFGSPTPLEIAVQGPALPANRAYAEKLRTELAKLPILRDLQYAQPQDYPTLEVNINRERAGQYDLTMSDISRSLVAATSSSRFTDPNYWRDPASGNAFQIQVEIPQHRIASEGDIRDVPIMHDGAARPLLGDVASFKTGTMFGEVDRYNMQRVVSLTANLHGVPLGAALQQVRAALAQVPPPPKGVALSIRGQVPALEQTLSGLRLGLLLSLVAIYLLLAGYFQSFRLALAVLATAPAVLCGVALMLLLTGTTLNIQSYLGAIMALGIAMANAILFITFAERDRHESGASTESAISAGRGRLRAIVMTASAMIAGMVPLALGTAATAPLGRAVIGGLFLATLATLFLLPPFYSLLQQRAKRTSPSLDPADPTSQYYDATT